MDDKLDNIINKVCDIEKKIHKSHMTPADSNVLSVGLKKLIDDRDNIKRTVKLRANNKYEDMEIYFINKINHQYVDLCENYSKILNLYSISMDKERESLLQYLGRE